MWQAFKNLMYSIFVDRTFCPKCEQSDRLAWRDGLWACPHCDLTPGTPLTFPNYPRIPQFERTFT